MDEAAKIKAKESLQYMTVEGTKINSKDAECGIKIKQKETSSKEVSKKERSLGERTKKAEDQLEKPWREEYLKLMNPTNFMRNLYKKTYEYSYFGGFRLVTVKKVNHSWL